MQSSTKLTPPIYQNVEEQKSEEDFKKDWLLDSGSIHVDNPELSILKSAVKPILKVKNDVEKTHLSDIDQQIKFKKLTEAIFKNDFSAAADLINQGLDLTQTDNSGNNALHFAAKSSPKMLEFMLSFPLNLNAQNSLGESPIIAAYKNKNVAGAKMLMENGADLNLVDNYGYSVMIGLAEIGNVSDYKEAKKMGLTPSLKQFGLNFFNSVSQKVQKNIPLSQDYSSYLSNNLPHHLSYKQDAFELAEFFREDMVKVLREVTLDVKSGVVKSFNH